MSSYFLLSNDEPAVPAIDSWIQKQEVLGCHWCSRITKPRVVNAEVQYLSSFSNLTTKTSRASSTRAKFGGGVAIMLRGLADAIGLDTLQTQYFMGSVICDEKTVPYVTLVPKEPSKALKVGAKKPLDIIQCRKCTAQIHAFDKNPCVEAVELVNPIYSVDCRADMFVVNSEIQTRVEALMMPEVQLTSIEIVHSLSTQI